MNGCRAKVRGLLEHGETGTLNFSAHTLTVLVTQRRRIESLWDFRRLQMLAAEVSIVTSDC